MVRLAQCNFEAWYRSPCTQEQSLRLLNIELIAGTEPVEHIDDFITALLKHQIFPRNTQLFFSDTNDHIDVSNLCGQQYQRVVVAGDRRQQTCIGRFNAATKPAPEVDFPRCVCTKIVLPVTEVGATGRVCVALT